MIRRLFFILLSLSSLSLILSACRAGVQPTPTPSVSPSINPNPSPSASPAMVQASIRPTVETNEATLAEVRKLEAEGKVTDVIVLESYPVQISLKGTPEAIAQLQRVAAGS